MPLKLTEKQKYGMELLNDPKYTRIAFTGGSRAGKSVAFMEFLAQRAYQFPGSRQLICRRALVDARRAIWDDTLKKYLNLQIPESEYTLMKSEMRVMFNNGSTIELGGLDGEDQLQKILGTEYLTIWLNEATEMRFDAVTILITRLAQSVMDITGTFRGVNKLIADANPSSPRNWVKKWFIDNVDPTTRPPKRLKDADKFIHLHFTPYDNIENLPPGYIEQLDALPYEMRERMLKGNWVGGEGQIFKEFNAEKHVVEPFEIPQSWERVRAIDFGYNHPCAVIYTAYDWMSDTIYVYDEYKQSGKTIDEIAEFLNETERKRNEYYACTWSDHDKSDRAFLAKHDIITRAAKKSVLDGINAVRQRLAAISPQTKKPKLIIFSNCEALIDEMYSYEWHKSDSEVMDKDSPIKINDDLVDTLRYVVYGRDRDNGILI